MSALWETAGQDAAPQLWSSHQHLCWRGQTDTFPEVPGSLWNSENYKSLRALRHPAKMEVTGRLFIWAALVASCGAQLTSTVAEGKKWNQILQFKHGRPAFTSGPLPKLRKLSYAALRTKNNSFWCSLEDVWFSGRVLNAHVAVFPEIDKALTISLCNFTFSSMS